MFKRRRQLFSFDKKINLLEVSVVSKSFCGSEKKITYYGRKELQCNNFRMDVQTGHFILLVCQHWRRLEQKFFVSVRKRLSSMRRPKFSSYILKFKNSTEFMYDKFTSHSGTVYFCLRSLIYIV